MFATNCRFLFLLCIGYICTGCSSPSPINEQATIFDIEPKHYNCQFSALPILIDGRIDDQAWQQVPWTDNFIDIEGIQKPRPRFETRAKMAWDDKYFYVAAILKEPHVWASLTEHDQIVYHDNDFEIFIDPDGDAAEYYEIEINALGTIFDLLLVKTYIDGGPALHDWNATGMQSAIHINGTLNDSTDIDQSWSVEFAIPWTLLKQYAHRPSPPQHGDVWRINFSRVQWQHQIINGKYERVPDTPENNWVWSPQGVINMHLPQHWGYVEFIEGER